MKHPYEFGGILFTIAMLGGILGGVAFDNYVLLGDSPCFYCDMINGMDNGVHEFVDMTMQKPSGSGSGSGSWSGQGQGISDPTPKSNYYNYEIQQCKKDSKDLQEFYNCVNG